MYIPTALSLREVEVLQRYAKGKTVVEAGSLLGFSTIQLAKVAHRVTSIDWHKGYPKMPNDTLRAFYRNIECAGVRRRIDCLFADVRRFIFPRADFTFIDLDGEAATTQIAIQHSSSRFIGVHDFERSQCRGVAVAVRRSGLEIVERADSLIILRSR